jgi:hypothetical protein
MPKYEVVVLKSKKITLDCKDYPIREDVVRYLDVNFPEWRKDDSLGVTIISMRRVDN